MLKKKKIVIVAVFLMAIMFAGSLVGAVNLFGPNNSMNNNPQNVEEIINMLVTPITQNISAIGQDNAKITVIEFGDYQCPFCKRFHDETRDKFIENFVDTGQAKLIFKDLVVNDHPEDRVSTLAAEASYCAAEQGKYWDYHDELYDKSEGENTGWITKESLKQFANNIRVPDLVKFSQCVEDHKYSEVVDENNNLARMIGLTATPSFILYNGSIPVAIQGAYPYEVFEQIIQDIS